MAGLLLRPEIVVSKMACELVFAMWGCSRWGRDDVTMLRTVSDAPTLWESVIPECLMGLPGDLGEIDELLDDPRFFEPFRAFFDPTHGRPSIPMGT
jgi:hypothetical protein